MTIDQLRNWFKHHEPTTGQNEAYREIREKGLELAETILRVVPESADQSDAIRKVREAVMTANSGIASAPGARGTTAGRGG